MLFLYITSFFPTFLLPSLLYTSYPCATVSTSRLILSIHSHSILIVARPRYFLPIPTFYRCTLPTYATVSTSPLFLSIPLPPHFDCGTPALHLTVYNSLILPVPQSPHPPLFLSIHSHSILIVARPRYFLPCTILLILPVPQSPRPPLFLSIHSHPILIVALPSATSYRCTIL